MQNRFSFGRFDPSFLVDGQRGGDVFSVTNWFGEYAGIRFGWRTNAANASNG